MWAGSVLQSLRGPPPHTTRRSQPVKEADLGMLAFLPLGIRNTTPYRMYHAQCNA